MALAAAKYRWITRFSQVIALARLLNMLALPMKSSAIAQEYANGFSGRPPRSTTDFISQIRWSKQCNFGRNTHKGLLICNAMEASFA